MLKCWNKLFTLKQEFGNCPECPTILGNIITLKMMAGDVAGLLDMLGIAEANVFGISMGGMISQETCRLNYPEKLNSLILGCTSCGGPRAVPMTASAFLCLPDSVDKLKATSYIWHKIH